MSWINFADKGLSKSGKTRLWDVMPTDGSQPIGRIGWYGPWRKYCFSPTENTVFEWQCLRDIAAFCESETKRHKS